METQDPRALIRRALTEYAGFFRGIASGENQEAADSIQRIKEIDVEATETLSEEQLGLYRVRRSRLMQLFRRRLFSELQDQVEKEVLTNVENLLKNLEEDCGVPTPAH